MASGSYIYIERERESMEDDERVAPVLSYACRDDAVGRGPLAPDSTKALESISVEQPPLYNGQLGLARRRLS